MLITGQGMMYVTIAGKNYLKEWKQKGTLNKAPVETSEMR